MKFGNIHFNSLFLLSIIGSFFFEGNIVLTKKIGLRLKIKKSMSNEHIQMENSLAELVKNNSDNMRDQLSYSYDKNYINQDLLRDSSFLINHAVNSTSNIVTDNFTIVSFFDNEYEVFNQITKQYTYYNVSSPFDEFQIAKNIKCGILNCKYPNVCINNNMCGCDNHFANIKSKDNKNENNCDYLRKSPIITSILEIIIPGAGFFYSGCIKYALLKFLFGIIVIILLFLQLCKNSRKNTENTEIIITNENQDRHNSSSNKNFFTETNIKEENVIKILGKKITSDRNTDNNSFKQNMNLYILIIFSITLLIWLLIDFFMIGMRMKKDGNGVGFVIYANYGNSY